MDNDAKALKYYQDPDKKNMIMKQFFQERRVPD